MIDINSIHIYAHVCFVVQSLNIPPNHYLPPSGLRMVPTLMGRSLRVSHLMDLEVPLQIPTSELNILKSCFIQAKFALMTLRTGAFAPHGE